MKKEALLNEKKEEYTQYFKPTLFSDTSKTIGGKSPLKGGVKVTSMTQERRDAMFKEGTEILKKKNEDDKNKMTVQLEECTHKPKIDKGSK